MLFIVLHDVVVTKNVLQIMLICDILKLYIYNIICQFGGT